MAVLLRRQTFPRSGERSVHSNSRQTLRQADRNSTTTSTRSAVERWIRLQIPAKSRSPAAKLMATTRRVLLPGITPTSTIRAAMQNANQPWMNRSPSFHHQLTGFVDLPTLYRRCCGLLPRDESRITVAREQSCPAEFPACSACCPLEACEPGQLRSMASLYRSEASSDSFRTGHSTLHLQPAVLQEFH